MKASNLKAILITAFCFVVALCSEIRCMDTASDLQEQTSYKAQNNHSGNYLDSLKPKIDNSLHEAMSHLNQDENEKSAMSWVSYVASPVKSVMSWTYDMADFAVKHPTHTIIISLLGAAQFTLVSAHCNCILGIADMGLVASHAVPTSLGMVTNATICSSLAATCERVYCRYLGCY